MLIREWPFSLNVMVLSSTQAVCVSTVWSLVSWRSSRGMDGPVPLPIHLLKDVSGYDK